MNSRPLLDYLALPDAAADSVPGPSARAADEGNPGALLEARLKALEAMLRTSDAPKSQKNEEATLAARIESILGRNAVEAAPTPDWRAPPAVNHASPSLRVVVDPPPTAPALPEPRGAETSAMDLEFLKFSEAVQLIGQAAKRFVEQPGSSSVSVPPQPAPAPPPPAVASAAAGEIEALSALLRETISAFRSVADDLAVSAGEIRSYATREERSGPGRHPSRTRYHDEEEDILDLRESVAELQDRLDMMMRTRRRARY